LKPQQTYELTMVAENALGQGTFSSIVTIDMLNEHDETSAGQLHHRNTSIVDRPLAPVHLRLSYSSSNLYISWDHPDTSEQSVPSIVHYVLQWRSTILFNNQQSHQFIVIDYPMRSYILKDIQQSNYIVQIVSYAERGTYSSPIESQINIRM
jgi:hypothetical protein